MGTVPPYHLINQVSHNRKGKCVNTVHFYGDQLWAAGTREQLPDLGGPDMGFLVKGDYYGEQSEEEEDTGGEVTDTAVEAVDLVANEVDNLKLDTGDNCEEEVNMEESVIDSRTPQEIMDSLLDWTFLLRLRAEPRGLPHVHQKLLRAPHGASHCLPGSLIL